MKVWADEILILGGINRMYLAYELIPINKFLSVFFTTVSMQIRLTPDL